VYVLIHVLTHTRTRTVHILVLVLVLARTRAHTHTCTRKHILAGITIIMIIRYILLEEAPDKTVSNRKHVDMT
jgi:hypothetical protein